MFRLYGAPIHLAGRLLVAKFLPDLERPMLVPFAQYAHFLNIETAPFYLGIVEVILPLQAVDHLGCDHFRIDLR